jgi:spore coat protein U-like protein
VSALAAAAVLLAAAPAAWAACEVDFRLVDFGQLDFRRGGAITGRVVVACDRPTAFTLALTPGFGSYAERRMRGPGGAELRYNLYVDPGYRHVWGDGASDGTATLQGATDGRAPVTLTVHGRVPGGQRVPPGPYADNLAVSLTY